LVLACLLKVDEVDVMAEIAQRLADKLKTSFSPSELAKFLRVMQCVSAIPVFHRVSFT
jgi:hypothetical protein